MILRRVLRQQCLPLRRYNHQVHTEEYPKEPGFFTKTWAKAVLFGLAAVGAYKYAPENGPEVYLTRWLEMYSTPSERWLEMNAKHTALAKQDRDQNLLFATAQRPVMHRYQYPQAFEQQTPYSRAVGMQQYVYVVPHPVPSSFSSAERPAHPARQPSIDQETAAKLEKRLKDRPDKNELVERNILKDTKVAPALAAAKEKLARSQLEDKLDHALANRPAPQKLVKDGILQEDEAPPSS